MPVVAGSGVRSVIARPGMIQGWCEVDGKDFVVLRNVKGFLAAYRLAPNGSLSRVPVEVAGRLGLIESA